MLQCEKARNEVFNMADIHSNIYTLRKSKKMSLEELGKKIGTSKQTIQRYESKEIKSIPYDKVVALADALDVTPAHLMGWSDEPITIDIEERKDDVMEQLIDTYAKRELLTPFIKMLNEMPEDYRTKALNYIKEVYKEYLFDKAMKGE